MFTEIHTAYVQYYEIWNQISGMPKEMSLETKLERSDKQFWKPDNARISSAISSLGSLAEITPVPWHLPKDREQAMSFNMDGSWSLVLPLKHWNQH